ncbi:hypothetical protein Ancab_022387 [Ancistrocladus abbreviatus]
MFKLKSKFAEGFCRRKRFSGKSMDKVLKMAFRRKDGKVLTLKDTCKPLLVPCFDLNSSAPFMFSRTGPLESASFNFELWKVCRAMVATPSTFRIGGGGRELGLGKGKREAGAGRRMREGEGGGDDEEKGRCLQGRGNRGKERQRHRGMGRKK